MQITGNTTGYDPTLGLQPTAGTVQPDADGDRQTSPGAGAPSGPSAQPQAPGSFATQFDASTLAGLLNLQQQTPGTDWGPHRHHGHHGHGHHGGASGAAQTAGDGSASPTADGPAAGSEGA
jgi:hypothetical protein